jgi:hypothetical protein
MIKYHVRNEDYNYIESNEKEYKNYKYWRIQYINENNLLHRLDGPAFELYNGYKEWYKDEKFHREDGPAREYNNIVKEYWYNGQQIPVNSDKEFKQYIKMKVFI